jgi:hypothetical protein
MMAAEPAARYASPDELVADLVSVGNELGLRPASPVSGIWTTSLGRPPRERIRAGWGWLGAFVALIVLVWSVDRSSRQSTEPLAPPKSAIVENARPESTVVAPAAPDIAVSAPARPATGGIGKGVAEAPHEFTATRAAPSPSQSGIKLPPLDASKFIDWGRSLVGSRPPTESTPTADVLTQDFVLQSVSDRTQQRYSSLEAAITAAADDDVIELDFDGRWGEVVRPIRISRRLTIRAAPRRRPQLVVGLTRDEALSVPTPKIFTVAGGSLFVADVDLVLSVPGGTTAKWSVFSLAQGGRVSLRGVSISVQNRDRQPVCVFDAASGAGPAIGRAVTDAMADRPLEISVESSIVRGGADLIWQDSSDVVDVRITQSAFALNGALFRQTAGAMPDAMAASRGPNELLLEHVTAVLERPLVLIELGERETTRPLQIDCRSSILKVTDGSQAMISISGQGEVNDYLDSLTWNGRNNWYDIAGPAVEIATPGYTGPTLTTLKLDEWLSRWVGTGASEVEQRTTVNPFANSDVWKQQDFSTVDTSDFSLDPSETNPVLTGADDGGAAGVDLEQRTLPKSLPEMRRADSASRTGPPRNRFAAEPFPNRPHDAEIRR